MEYPVGFRDEYTCNKNPKKRPPLFVHFSPKKRHYLYIMKIFEIFEITMKLKKNTKTFKKKYVVLLAPFFLLNAKMILHMKEGTLTCL